MSAALSPADRAAWAAALDVLDPPPKPDVFTTLGYTPTPKQQLFHDATEFDTLFGGSLGGGKLLRIDEPIPTPRGWTTMGEIRPGDQVFTERGESCLVLGAYQVDLNPIVYRLSFDDGTVIEAGADHEWLTFDHKEMHQLTTSDPEWRARCRAKQNPPVVMVVPTGTVRTTKQIAGSLRTAHGATNHAVPVASALQLPAVELPIDPYVLGAWLGDGSSADAGFTSADEEIIAQLRASGLTVRYAGTATRPYAYRLGDRVWASRSHGRAGWVNTWAVSLRELGVSPRKHIPMAYLRASVEQRLALLQGLMDTDGTVNKTGQVEFSSTNAALAHGVFELVVSLGWKVRLRERHTKLNGKDCGPQWVLKWSADRVVFRIPRKAIRQQLAVRRTTRFRYITGCEEIASTPMRCITVDNPTNLYLAGQSMVPTHNTRALVTEAIKACVKHPGLRVGVFRRSYGELRDSVITELAQLGFAQTVGAKWNGSEFELKFSNSSLIMFRYAENMLDASRRQGAQYQLLVFDERTQLLPDVVSFLESRLRSGRADIPVLGIRSSANPGGPSHGHVRARYIDATNHGERVITDHAGRTIRFIPSTMRDNPHLDTGYETRLLALPETMRKALREGDWGAFAGQMFTELDYHRHIIQPVHLPPSWARYNGIDWGFAAPWAVLWVAVDEDGRVWAYRELYETQVGEADQACRILAAEARGEHVTARFADDAMWATRGDAKPIAGVYADNGVYLTPAGKGAGSRINGWQRIRSYLDDAPACPHHRAQGWATCPKLHIFATCENLYRELRDLPHATKGNPEDADTTAPDHLCDAARYVLANLGSGPQFVIPDDEPAPLNATVGRPLAGFAHVQRDDEPADFGGDWWPEETDTPRNGAVRTVR